jgi:alcohol dehydrogenase class IV
MTPFEFATATRIVFGAGSLSGIGPLAAGLGSRALVVTGRNPDRAKPLHDLLRAQGIAAASYPVDGEPTIETARCGVEMARTAACDLIIGYGGGSALDAGKAIAALLANGGAPLDYLEVIGAGRALEKPSAPCIAIPTTAGTGAEVTRNAVLGSPEHRVKVSLRSPHMLPRIALVDPNLTLDLPPDLTATTGLDALTQLIEPYVSNRANPITDLFCRDGMARAARSLRRAYEQGHDAHAREEMALASLYGGLALANARLGAVHGFAGPLGGMVPAPHGALCARLLPGVMAGNVKALRAREPSSPALVRYLDVARLLTGNPIASIDDGLAWIASLCAAFPIPTLGAYGLATADLPLLIRNAAKASSMQGNPIQLTETEMEGILLQAL